MTGICYVELSGILLLRSSGCEMGRQNSWMHLAAGGISLTSFGFDENSSVIFFSHPSANWGFHLVSAVYSSCEAKSGETFDSVNSDHKLQLKERTPPDFQQTEVLTRINQSNQKAVKCLTQLLQQFVTYLLYLQLAVTGSVAESAVATEAKYSQTSIQLSSWWTAACRLACSPGAALLCLTGNPQSQGFWVDTWTPAPPEPPWEGSCRQTYHEIRQKNVVLGKGPFCKATLVGLKPPKGKPKENESFLASFFTVKGKGLGKTKQSLLRLWPKKKFGII